MPHPANMTINRATVCLSWRQREFILVDTKRLGLGVSECIRRMMDDYIDRKLAEEEFARKMVGTEPPQAHR